MHQQSEMGFGALAASQKSQLEHDPYLWLVILCVLFQAVADAPSSHDVHCLHFILLLSHLLYYFERLAVVTFIFFGHMEPYIQLRIENCAVTLFILRLLSQYNLYIFATFKFASITSLKK